MVDGMATEGKAALRKRLLSARRDVTHAVQADEARLLIGHLEDQLASSTGSEPTICAYVPVRAEPGSIEMLDMLLRHAVRVLLPVALTSADDSPLPLRWAPYRPGGLTSGRWGLLEPPEPWLPPAALGDATLVLVPALAVDRNGVRLGRGRGFYDRSLMHRHPQARLVAVVRDCELVGELPAEPHDVPMTHALAPRRGLIALPAREWPEARGGSST